MITINRKKILICLSILLILISAVSGQAYEWSTVTNGGMIRGFVKYQGKIPGLPPPEVFKFKEICKDLPNETLIIGRDSGVRYAVLTLEGITRGKAVEREVAHELDNVGCRFVPHVQAASVGQWLVIKNSDPILHTAHAVFEKGGQPQFNVGLYPGRISRKPLVSPGIVRVFCEVHPWMSAYVVVTEHPYHAVTDVYGEFEIRDIPPGSYRLKAWHESLGTRKKKVEVKGGAISRLDFVFSSSHEVKK
jgi:hypothetical protein